MRLAVYFVTVLVAAVATNAVAAFARAQESIEARSHGLAPSFVVRRSISGWLALAASTGPPLP